VKELKNSRNIFEVKFLAGLFLVVVMLCAVGNAYAYIECTDYGDCVFCIVYSETGEYQGYVSNCGGGGSATS